MRTIALIGGNSQVATEVALFLSTMPGITVIPICRSPFGAAFLKHCGISCKAGDIGDPDEATKLLAGADVVADFSRSSGTAGNIKRRIEATIRNMISQSSRECRLVFISSQMAFGIRPSDRDRHYRLISRTAYGATKRFGERLALRLARQARKEMYVLRLGQVHGELQGVSRKLRDIFAEGKPIVLPDSVSDTVFAFTIAEALASIAEGKETPGTYTLMSTPDWHWRDVYKYYCDAVNAEPELHLYKFPVTSARTHWLGAIQSSLFRLLQEHRESIAVYCLSHFPGLEQRIAARYRNNNVARDVARLIAPRGIVHCNAVVGPFAGKRLTSLSDSRVSMDGPAKRLRALLDRAAPHIPVESK